MIYLTIPEMGGYFMCALRGLICFKVQKKARIYNPSTRQLLKLPSLKSDIIAQVVCRNIVYFIGYDPNNDRYKLLCIVTKISKDTQKIMSEFWIFLLEAGGSWKRVAHEFHPHLPQQQGLIMNGILYYSASTDSHGCVLVSFDIESGEFDMLQVPHRGGDVLPTIKTKAVQTDYCGKVAVFDFAYLSVTGSVDLWVVEDWRKKEWSMKTLDLQPSQWHLFSNSTWMPKSTTSKGRIIFLPRKLAALRYFIFYDVQTNYLEKVEIRRTPKQLLTTKCSDLVVMDPWENIIYLES